MSFKKRKEYNKVRFFAKAYFQALWVDFNCMFPPMDKLGDDHEGDIKMLLCNEYGH